MDGPVRLAGAGGGRTPFAPAPDGRGRVGRVQRTRVRHPCTERAVSALSGGGVRLLVNLHQRLHDPDRLERHGLKEVHLPVRDFAALSPEQIGRGVGALLETLAAGEAAAVHSGGGLGRTGTVLACYLLASDEGLGPEEAVRRVRAETGLRGDVGPAGGDTERGPGSRPTKGLRVQENAI